MKTSFFVKVPLLGRASAVIAQLTFKLQLLLVLSGNFV